MRWLVEIAFNEDAIDPLGASVKSEIEDLGITNVKFVKTLKNYIIDTEPDVKDTELDRTCQELLADNQIQQYNYVKIADDVEYNPELESSSEFSGAWLVEVRNNPGVTDAVGESARMGIEMLGIDGIKNVKTGFSYIIGGELTDKELELISKRCLANIIIQHFKIKRIG
jgi:phosphoribosylformylglycinamidine (FGAM) synthase PurS component